jgi:sulfite exporter TauE/SafE
MLTALTAGATFGLLNLAHCAGMCGPVSSVACLQAGKPGLWRYQVGRVIGYSTAGAMAGHLGQGLGLAASVPAARWVFASLTAAACLIAARSLTRGPGPQVRFSVSRPRASAFVKMIGRLLPREPLSLGLLSALLPCGLLATVLLAAVATGDGQHGAALMFGFANTSGLALIGAGWLAQVAPARVSLAAKRGMAIMLVGLALFTVGRPLVAAGVFRSGTSNSEVPACCH